MSSTDTAAYSEEIAIIGMAGRFPGAPDVATFWKNICDGVESVSFFTEQQLDDAGVSEEVRRRPNFVPAGAVLEGVDRFDAPFFSLMPREAEVMDPQQRLFLECAWEALEHAGYEPGAHRGAVGTFAGVGLNSYLMFHLLPQQDLSDTVGVYQTIIANDKDFLATRVAYKLNLTGPSLVVQTACSTSLVAVHVACQSLLNGECDMAIAGGVSVLLPQQAGYLYEPGMILSPDGHCRAFDETAQGTVRGNGLGIVVLKPLQAALSDGDEIYAVIKGSAINNDGAEKIGYTAPSMERQRDVIVQAQMMARISADSLQYIEAHGTGTSLGDPIEVEALTEAFRVSTPKKRFCAIGSVKTNIGHLDTAAGVAGLIKATLMLKHRVMPPSLHFERPNPRIDFANSPFYVNTQLTEWKAEVTPRRAGVSSFGIGGTNAHVVLEEPPVPAPGECNTARSSQLLVISAKSEAALARSMENLTRHLGQHPELKLQDVARTLQAGRKRFNHRCVLVCEEREQAVNALRHRDPVRLLSSVEEAVDRPVIFMFPGQGTQYVDMGRELYGSEPVFRQAIDECSELFRPLLGLDIRTVMYPGEAERGAAAGRLVETAIAQAALFAIEYALAQLWTEWGVRPQAMIGHSLGEYVAACLAGVFSLQDAVPLVALRGRLMQSCPLGTMLAVELPEDAIRRRLAECGELSIAAVNGINLCVVSGPTDAVRLFEAEMAREGVTCRLLRTSHAFHSAMMDPILETFTQQMRQVKLQPPQIPYVTNVTGRWVTAAEATSPMYWARQLRDAVRFSDGLQVLFQQPNCVLLEVGPGQTLTSLARQHPARVHSQAVLGSIPHPGDPQPEAAFLLNTLGKLWLAGAAVDWDGFHRHEETKRVALPTYPFERQSYWIDRPARSAGARLSSPPEALPGNWLYLPAWKEAPLRAAAGSLQVARPWLIFMDACGIGAHLASRLEEGGHTVSLVEAAQGYARTGDHRWTVRPGDAGDYERLFADLQTTDRRAHSIVHLWGVTDRGDGEALADLDQTQARGFYSVAFLARAMVKTGAILPSDLWVVTTDMQAVTGEELLCPEKATVLGPCRVIPQEYTEISCRSVDLTFTGTEASPAACADCLWRELDAAAGTDDSTVAYRGDRRLIETFEPAPMMEAGGVRRLREGGVYLITGGLGGLGQTLADHLARTVHAKLVLVGRSALPPRETWDGLLAQRGNSPETSARIRKIRELEALGAEVLTASADVADLQQMRSVVEMARQRFGAIHGVIHAAGVSAGGPIDLMEPAEAADVLRPKVAGTLTLDALFRGDQLDFLVLCSSLTSILGIPGQVDYCAANAFLDAYAQARRAEGGAFAVAIDWDTWTEFVKIPSGKVARRLAAMAGNVSAAPGTGLLAREGVRLFDGILSQAWPQVIVSKHDWAARLRHARSHPAPGDRSVSVAAPGSRSFHPRPPLSNLYVPPRHEAERVIARVWQELLGIDQIGIHDNFFELGGTSLIGVKVIARLQEVMGVEISTVRLFEGPTVRALAELLAQGDQAAPYDEHANRGRLRKEFLKRGRQSQ